MLAEQAVANGWAGVVMYGCVRDVEILASLPIGVQALGSHPRKSENAARDSEISALPLPALLFSPASGCMRITTALLLPSKSCHFLNNDLRSH